MPPGDQFCGVCGTAVGEAAAAASRPKPPKKATPDAPEPPLAEPVAPPKSVSKRKPDSSESVKPPNQGPLNRARRAHILLWIVAGILAVFEIGDTMGEIQIGPGSHKPPWVPVLIAAGGFWVWLSIKRRLNSARVQGIGYALYVILAVGYSLAMPGGLWGGQEFLPPLYVGTELLAVVTLLLWLVPGVRKGLKTY